MANSLSDTIIQFISGIQNLNFELLWIFFIGYIVFMWLIASVWVFFDAKRRYQSNLLIIGITIFVFVCNVPALILYVMMRPEYTKDELELIQEGIANMFIKSGHLLGSPKPIVEKDESTETLQQTAEVNEVGNGKTLISKNVNNEIEIEQSFIQSLQISFEIIYYTFSKFISHLITNIANGYKYLTSIRIEFEEKNNNIMMDTREGKGTIATDMSSTGGKVNSVPFSKKQRKITQNKKSNASEKVKNESKEKLNLKKQLEISTNRKKIPQVKFVMK